MVVTAAAGQMVCACEGATEQSAITGQARRGWMMFMEQVAAPVLTCSLLQYVAPHDFLIHYHFLGCVAISSLDTTT